MQSENCLLVHTAQALEEIILECIYKKMSSKIIFSFYFEMSKKCLSLSQSQTNDCVFSQTNLHKGFKASITYKLKLIDCDCFGYSIKKLKISWRHVWCSFLIS